MEDNGLRSVMCRPTVKTFATACCAVVLILFASGCQTGSRNEQLSDADNDALPVLRIGTAASAPPLVFKLEGNVVGLEIDLADELAKRLKRQPRIVSIYFDNLPLELRRKRIDIIMAGMTVTATRQETMAFSEPYLNAGQRLLFRADSKLNADTLDRAGNRIGAENSSTGSIFAHDAFKQAEVVDYPTLANTVEALRQNKVSAVIYDAPAVAWIIKQDPEQLFTSPPDFLNQESIAWAVHPDNDELLAQVNQALTDMRADGTLDRLIEKWLGSQ